MLSLAMASLFAAVPPLETAPPPHAPPLNTVQLIRRLTVEEAARKQPVRLRGVVTYVSPAIRDLFVQDATAGIYVMPNEFTVGLRVGDAIEVEGVTDPGEFAPCVVATRIRAIGRTSPPPPLPFTMLPEDSRWLDGQFVQAWGVVSAISSNDQFTYILLYNSHGRVRVCLPDAKLAPALTGLVNHAVSVRGICVPAFDPNERVIKNEPTNLFTNSVPMIAIAVGQPTTNQAIDNLRRFSPDPHPGARRVIVSGVVTAVAPNGAVYVQDATGGIAALPEGVSNAVIGDRVDMTGLVAIEANRIRMLRATIEVKGTGELPEAQPAEIGALAQGRFHAMLVTTRGRVDEVAHKQTGTFITLLDGSSRLDAHLPAGIEPPPVGSRVSATGVLGRQNPFETQSASTVLWLRGSGDLCVLELPPSPPPLPWWTTGRIAAALAIPFVLAVLAFAWIALLRRQVRRQTEALRRQFAMQTNLEDKLRTSQKLEAIGRLAGGIAHDFNNLLTVINGCGELLSNGLPPHSPQKDLARDIRSAGERAASLVSQLLLFSRRQSVRLHSIDLRTALKEAERMLTRVIGETIRVQCEIAPDTPLVRAEATLVHQIILNLAVNARDAMPVGGTLRIATTRHVVGERVFARLSVTDSGVGMDEPTRARIFEPFFTTKPVGAGTGLGLATVYGIVQTLEGEIRCQSTIGRGTTFEIDLPAAVSSESRPAAGSRHRPVMTGHGTVLLCEDDRAVRELTSHILRAAGYLVLAPETPTDAARLAETHPGRIDLLLTDLVMPELSGRELADLIAPMRPDMKIVFMTGYTDDEIIRQGYAFEELDVIAKPFTPAILTGKLNEVLNRDKSEIDSPDDRRERESPPVTSGGL